MIDRLILGRDRLIRQVAESRLEAPGSVFVGTDDDHFATVLQDAGIPVSVVDITTPGALNTFDEPDIVMVIEQSEERLTTVSSAVETAFPDAHLITFDDSPAPTTVKNGDTTVSAQRYIRDHVMAKLGDYGQRLRQLSNVLRGIDHLAVVAHDNPDPDAIASGIGLASLASAFGCESTVCYYGNITHQENRAFVNVLELDLLQLEPGEELSGFDGIALVDHSRPGINDQLPEDTDVDIVIDHHPPRTPVDARFVDLRSDVGATSTLVTEYLDLHGLSIGETVATALFFGIQVDTDRFTREVSTADFEAAATLIETADLNAISRIESPSISTRTLETVARAYQNREIVGPHLYASVGMFTDRDALSQAADHLLTLEGVETTLIFGIMDDTIYLSARAQSDTIDIGETLRQAFDQVGSAGGHADMAGGQIPIGIIGEVDEEETIAVEQSVEAVIGDRYLDVIKTGPSPLQPSSFDQSLDGRSSYLISIPEDGTDEE